jgi:hypothetical protein
VQTAVGGAVLQLVASLLQLRGLEPQLCPIEDSATGAVLCFNGEVFGGAVQVPSEANDGAILLHALMGHPRESSQPQEPAASQQQECLTIQGVGCKERHAQQGQMSTQVAKRGAAVSGVLSSVEGPWALVLWDPSCTSLFFGRDVMGRRSLLAHFPSEQVGQGALCFTAPLAGAAAKPWELGPGNLQVGQTYKDWGSFGSRLCSQRTFQESI